jgi:hypothetical protein
MSRSVCHECGYNVDAPQHRDCIRKALEIRAGVRQPDRMDDRPRYDPLPPLTLAGLPTPDDITRWAQSMTEEDWLR